MQEQFKKLGVCYRYMWIAMLFVLLGSIGLGIVNQYNDTFQKISKADTPDAVHKLVTSSAIMKFAADHMGESLAAIVVMYLGVVIVYVVVALVIPNLMYAITSLIVKRSTATSTSIIVWILNYIAMIPGIWCTVKMLALTKLLSDVDMVLIQQVGTMLVQVGMIIMNICVMVMCIRKRKEGII